MLSYAFYHNEFIPLVEARMSVMTHCIHYSTGIMRVCKSSRKMGQFMKNWLIKLQRLLLLMKLKKRP